MNVRLEYQKISKELSIEKIQYRKDNIDYIHLHIKEKKAIAFPETSLMVYIPCSNIQYRWTPKLHLIKALNLDWFQNLYITNGFTGAPVEAYISADNQNCACIGVSDTLHTIGLKGSLIEETAEYGIEIILFQEEQISSEYEIIIRIDMREIPYFEALKDMATWWAELPNQKPAFVPTLAKEPMYSTWYSFHQQLEEEALLTQCRLAKELGLKSLLIDDGWQTDDNNRGYAYCGDWLPAISKISDMKAFVKKVHEIGLKVIPWYCVPFIGEKSKNFHALKDMVIDAVNDREWYVLDPRYPEVRDFIIQLYETALREWDIDGFKLDFIDEFVVTPFSGKKEDKRRDFVSFIDATDKLMKDCMKRLKAIKPDIILEFRQTYNGPIMRTYGNIFRAVDCPLDAIENRVRVTDIRLLSGNTAVHSDMIMWNKEDSVENVALQFINIMFSVPQISMRLEELNKEQKRMLIFYCKLWNEFKKPLLYGTFKPYNPSCRYNVIIGEYDNTLICTYYSKECIEVEKSYAVMVFINGSFSNILSLQYKGGAKSYKMISYNCMGEVTSIQTIHLNDKYYCYDIAKSGVIRLEEQ